MDFRIKEYMSSTFKYMSLIPGELVENIVKPRETKAAIGAFLQCREDGSRYALTVAHAIKEGDICRAVNKYGYERVIGKCVATINKRSKPMSFDIAVILINNDFGEEIENTIFNSQGDKCTFRLPESDDETRAMECWKIQRKAHGTWQYGYLRHAIYTNKEHGIYRGITVVRAHETCPMLTEGECGSLVTSLPRAGKLTVYGMFMGRLEQEPDDGGDPLELYIAFPFRHAINELQKLKMFHGKTLEFLGNNQEGEINENDQMGPGHSNANQFSVGNALSRTSGSNSQSTKEQTRSCQIISENMSRGASNNDMSQAFDQLNNHIPSTISNAHQFSVSDELSRTGGSNSQSTNDPTKPHQTFKGENHSGGIYKDFHKDNSNSNRGELNRSSVATPNAESIRPNPSIQYVESVDVSSDLNPR